MTTIATSINHLNIGDMIIPAGRKLPVEIVSIDNWGTDPDVWLIGHYGRGFNVSSVRTAGTVEKVAITAHHAAPVEGMMAEAHR